MHCTDVPVQLRLLSMQIWKVRGNLYEMMLQDACVSETEFSKYRFLYVLLVDLRSTLCSSLKRPDPWEHEAITSICQPKPNMTTLTFEESERARGCWSFAISKNLSLQHQLALTVVITFSGQEYKHFCSLFVSSMLLRHQQEEYRGSCWYQGRAVLHQSLCRWVDTRLLLLNYPDPQVAHGGFRSATVCVNENIFKCFGTENNRNILIFEC